MLNLGNIMEISEFTEEMGRPQVGFASRGFMWWWS